MHLVWQVTLRKLRIYGNSAPSSDLVECEDIIATLKGSKALLTFPENKHQHNNTKVLSRQQASNQVSWSFSNH